MLTDSAKQPIDRMATHEELEKVMSIHWEDKELVAYAEERKRSLDRIDDAMIEYTPLDDFGQM